MCKFHGEDADCDCGRRFDNDDYEESSFERMMNDIRAGHEAPLLDWIIENPADYPRLCQAINLVKEEIQVWVAEAREGMRGEVLAEDRPDDIVSPFDDLLWKLGTIRNAAADMLGYEERPPSEWEANEWFAHVLNEEQEAVLDPRIFPREDEFGVPLSREEV